MEQFEFKGEGVIEIWLSHFQSKVNEIEHMYHAKGPWIWDHLDEVNVSAFLTSRSVTVSTLSLTSYFEPL